ncbi:polysaccharide biosynthesis tyrosine autokinase [Balneolales bacterium ANBcel1]|nr:polysaccharide biosynthesis tyrosine autokinase [Balneolales bacterium ANBcel1]
MSPNEHPHPNGSSNGRYHGELPGTNNTGQPAWQDDDELDVKKLFFTIFRYKWIILACLILGTAAGYFYASSQTPIFRGEGSMLITEDRSRYSMAGSDLGSLLTTSFGIGQSSRLHNELEVIRSRRFAGEIADRLLSDPYQPDGRIWPVLWEEYPEDSTIVDRQRVIHRIREYLTAELKNRDTDVVQITFESPSREEARQVVNLVLDEYYDFSTRQNRVQARSAIEFLEREEAQLRERLAESENRLRDFMSREGVIQLDAQSTRLVQTLSELEAERKSVEVNMVAVNSAIDSYESELEAIRPGLADQFSASRSQRLVRYQFQLAELETEKMLMVSRNPELRENPRLEPSYVRLQDQAEEFRREIRALTADLMEHDERFLGFLDTQGGGVTSRLAEMRQELLQLRVEQSQLDAQARVLDERIADEEQFFDRVPDNMVEMARLQRDMKVQEQLYLTISQQTAELGVWEQTQMGYGRVVDYSVLPISPVSPRVPVLLMIGFIIGGMAGVGYAFVREMTTTEINSIDKLKERKLPVLSVIPDLRPFVKEHYDGRPLVNISGHTISTDMVSVLDSISPTAEAYRRLQSNLIYSQPDKPYRVICASSPSKSEGKTTVMSNLAVTLAESGKRVVLMDCDFRRQRVHKEFGVETIPGVVDYLFDEVPETAIIRPTLVDGVDVIPAGKRTPNPAGISRSAKLGELIDSLKERYDFVLIDAPPYGIITDAAPIMTRADGVLLVTRFNQTREADLDQTIENLRNIRANIIGVVMNAFDHKKATGYYYTSTYYRYAYTDYNAYVEEKS